MTADGYITTEDGVRLFLEKSGTGPTTLVILNGFLYLDDFKYLGSQHTLVSVDVRNRGRSDLLSDPSWKEAVLGPIQNFLAGSWPTAAEKVSPRTGSERL